MEHPPIPCPDCGLNHKLKICPYCGSAHCLLLDFMHPDGGVRYYATCEVCHASGPESGRREEAVEQWNSLPRKLRWTTKPPSQEGWYFLREAWASGKWRNHGLVFVYFDKETETLQIRGWGRSIVGVASWGHPQQKRKPEWAGPIPMPQE